MELNKNKEQRTALVTGVSGYMGGYFAQYLSENEFTFVGTYNNHKCSGTYSTVKCDLSKNIDIDGKFEVVIHCAGLQPYSSPYFESGRIPSFNEYKLRNIDAMKNIIEYAKRSGVKKIINISTIGVYGEIRNEIMNEDTPMVNVDDYGATKYAAELLLKESGIEGISLRLPGIIGKGARGIWAASAMEKMMHDEDMHVYSPEFITKNFVWIRDLAKFIVKLIDMNGWKYNELVLGCREGEKVIDIVQYMKEMIGSSSEIIIEEGVRKSFCIQADRAFEMGYETMKPLEIIDSYWKTFVYSRRRVCGQSLQ